MNRSSPTHSILNRRREHATHGGSKYKVCQDKFEHCRRIWDFESELCSVKIPPLQQGFYTYSDSWYDLSLHLYPIVVSVVILNPHDVRLRDVPEYLSKSHLYQLFPRLDGVLTTLPSPRDL